MDGLAAMPPCRLRLVWAMPDGFLGWVVPEPEPGWFLAVRRALAPLLAEAVEEALAPAPVGCVVDLPEAPLRGPEFTVEYVDDESWDEPEADRRAELLIAAARSVVTDTLPAALRRAKRSADALWVPLTFGRCELPCCAGKLG
jgi:hypothetical protein